MPQFDFYILQSQHNNHRAQTACRLTEKAYGLAHQVFIQTSSAQQAEYIDDLLWTFRDGSFIPHEITTTPCAEAPLPAVTIGVAGSQPHHDIVINLSDQLPDDISQFNRIIEIVGGQDPERKTARDRFRHYRGLGFKIQTHEIKN